MNFTGSQFYFFLTSQLILTDNQNSIADFSLIPFDPSASPSYTLPTMAKLNHIAILVENLDEAVPVFNKVWGLEPDHIVNLEDHGIRTAAYHFENIMVELMEPLGENSGMRKTLDKRGPGIHHAAVEIDDLKSKMDSLKEDGMRFTSDEPAVGYGGNLITFLHPKSTHGILTELVQLKKED